MTGDDALEWVRERNKSSDELSSSTEFESLQEQLLAIYNSDDRIPYVGKRGEFFATEPELAPFIHEVYADPPAAR